MSIIFTEIRESKRDPITLIAFLKLVRSRRCVCVIVFRVFVVREEQFGSHSLQRSTLKTYLLEMRLLSVSP